MRAQGTIRHARTGGNPTLSNLDGLTSTTSEATADLRILAAAEKLFADRGFKETSIQMLADSAGVNRALIFYYFKNKEALYRRLIETAYAALEADMRNEMQNTRSPVEALKGWVRVTCRAMGRSPNLLRLLLREVAGPGPAVLPVGRYTDDVERPLREIIELGCSTGVFRPVDAPMTAISLMGIMTAFFRRRYVTGQDFEADTVADHVLALILNGMLSA